METNDRFLYRLSTSGRHGVEESRLPILAHWYPLIDTYVVSMGSDAQSNYGLIQRLRTSLTPGDRDLSLVDAMPNLHRELMRRLSTLQTAAAKPGATASTVMTAICDEAQALATGANSTGQPQAAGASSLASGPISACALRDEDFTMHVLSLGFKAIESSLIGLHMGIASSRRDGIAAGFNGAVPLAVRILLSTSENGDERAKRNATLNTLNGLRPFRSEYFDYMLAVNVATGVVDPQIAKFYSIAAARDDSFLMALCNLKMGSLRWVAAPHGLLGYLQARDGKSAPDNVKHIDEYVIPEVLRELGPFGQRLLTSIGMPSSLAGPPGALTATMAPYGFTFETYFAFYAEHIRMAARLATLREQIAWLMYADIQNAEVLTTAGRLLHSAIFSGTLQPINGEMVPYDIRPLSNLREKQASLLELAARRQEWELFGPGPGPGSSNNHAAKGLLELPRLSAHRPIIESLMASDAQLRDFRISDFEARGSKRPAGGLLDEDAQKNKRAGKEDDEGRSTITFGGAGTIAPGSALKAFRFVGTNQLVISGRTYDLAALRKYVGGRDLCWPFLLVASANDKGPSQETRASRCGKFAEHSKGKAVKHAWPAGKSFEEAKRRFSREATAAERAGISSPFYTARGRGQPGRGRSARGRSARGRGRGGRGGDEPPGGAGGDLAPTDAETADAVQALQRFRQPRSD